MRNFRLTACIVLFATFHACFGWVAWAARGDFPVGLLVEFFSTWLAIGAAALAIGTAGAAFYFRRKGRKMRHLPKCVWLVACMALLSVVGAGGTYFGKRTTESEIKEAKAYVETMEPLLRTYFAENGRFPETLDSFGVNHPRDGLDVQSMITAGLVKPARLLELFQEVEGLMIRYPAVDAANLRKQLEELTARNYGA